MSKVDEKSFIEQMVKAVEDINRKQAEYEREQLIRLCEENDFIVPSEEVRKQLEEVLPEGTKIIVDKILRDCILMVKKIALNPFITTEITFGEGEK